MGNQQAKTEDIAWLAGFIDGEGSLMMLRHSRGMRGYPYSQQWRPAIKVGGTHIPTLNEVTGVLDAMGLPYHVSWRTPQSSRWAKSWMVEITGLKRCLRWATALKGYLRTKREDCDLMLEYCHTRLAQRPSWNLKASAQGAKPQLTDRQLEIVSRLRGRRGGIHVRYASETTR
jgi:hypothetical protein